MSDQPKSKADPSAPPAETAPPADPAAPPAPSTPPAPPEEPPAEQSTCEICFPYGPPEGALTWGCEHTA